MNPAYKYDFVDCSQFYLANISYLCTFFPFHLYTDIHWLLVMTYGIWLLNCVKSQAMIMDVVSDAIVNYFIVRLVNNYLFCLSNAKLVI